jgi:hypothetical protein
MRRGSSAWHKPSLNIELQNALNPPGEISIERFGWTFCPGDKVMQVENDYDKEVYNGDLGVVSRIDMEEGELSVDFEGREVIYGFGELDELVLAYATTIHKSQGSEYSAVVIPLSTQHYPMLQRNLVYTGVTRGKRLVVLVGQRKALAIAVKGTRARRRWSKLREWLIASDTPSAKQVGSEETSANAFVGSDEMVGILGKIAPNVFTGQFQLRTQDLGKKIFMKLIVLVINPIWVENEPKN